MGKTKIKLLTSIAGPGIFNRRGDVIEVESNEAKRHVEAGNAVYHIEEDEKPSVLEKIMNPMGSTTKGKKPRIETRK